MCKAIDVINRTTVVESVVVVAAAPVVTEAYDSQLLQLCYFTLECALPPLFQPEKKLNQRRPSLLRLSRKEMHCLHFSS
jgi:hypothetical protein